jgi:ribosomal protein L40E
VALARLAHVLHRAGHEQVVRPACAGCGAVTTALVPGPAGRVCAGCVPRREPKVCARCGQLGRINARRPEGGICHRCYRTDPEATHPCSRCGARRLAAGRVDGQPVCELCW